MTFANRLILAHKRVMLDSSDKGRGDFMEDSMAITRAMALAVAVTGAAVGLAGPAWADDRLDGAYTYMDGPTTNTWSITTFCNEEVTCGGTVSTSTGLVAQINRVAGGPWTVERHDVSNGWVCADGSSGRGRHGLLVRSGEPGGDAQLHFEARGVQRPQPDPSSETDQPAKARGRLGLPVCPCWASSWIRAWSMSP